MHTFDNSDLAFQFDNEIEFPCLNTSPTRFISWQSGVVVLVNADTDEVIEIGAFRLAYVDIHSAMNEHESVGSIFEEDLFLEEFFRPLYVKSGSDFRQQTYCALQQSFVFPRNLLMLERLVIYRPFRGRNYGLNAILGLIELRKAGVGIVAMKPFPLQHTASDRDERFSESVIGTDPRWKPGLKASKKTLFELYKSIGFTRVGGTGLMVISPSKLKDSGCNV